MYKCNKCGEKVRGSGFYCYSCKQKEIKKMEQRAKVNEKRRLQSEIKRFETWQKSGSRTHQTEKKMEDKEQMKKLEECFKKAFHKKVDRVYWEHKYIMALAVIDNIEGMIGMRVKDKVAFNSKKEGDDKNG